MCKRTNKSFVSEWHKINPMKALWLFFVALVLFTGSTALAAFPSDDAKGMKDTQKKAILQKAVKLQIPFIENQGQIPDKSIRFYARTFGGTAYVTNQGEMVYAFSGAKKEAVRSQGHVLKEKLVGASTVPPKGLDPAKTRVNYFLGNEPKKWKSNLPTFNTVCLAEVYPGIELDLKANGKKIEKIFTIKPSADPGSILLNLEGAKALTLTKEGELEILTSIGTVRFSKPLAFQEKDNQRRNVEVSYHLQKDGYGFNVGTYDLSMPLVIDPTLIFSSYLGGSQSDYAEAIATDANGDVYVAGGTSSVDFPTGGTQYGPSGMGDVFVVKFDGSMSTVLYSTFVGGSSSDAAHAIAVDGDGYAYVTGTTYSSDYPTTGGAVQQTYPGGFNSAFVTVLTPSGALGGSTYLGGSDGTTEGFGIALDGLGNGIAYVIGSTTSSTGFPLLNALQDYNAGGADAFVTKIGSGGGVLYYSTYLGGSNQDEGRAIAVDQWGSAYVTGYTGSNDFPVTTGAYQESFNGQKDVFVTRLTQAGGLNCSTYLGGGSEDYGYGIALKLHEDGYATSVYVTGRVGSPDPNIFLAKFYNSLSGLIYSTQLGGTGSEEYGYGVAVDGAENAYVVGFTDSSDFPVTSDAYQFDPGGDDDAFVAKIDTIGGPLLYATYLGGLSEDRANGISLDSAGNIYIAGRTQSDDFPIVDAYQNTFGGIEDAFVAKFSSAVTLSVEISGTGSGTVRSQVAGIDCGGDCDEDYPEGTMVSLMATPDPGSFFEGWEVDGTPFSVALNCKITMDDAKTATAVFTAGTPTVATWAKFYAYPGTTGYCSDAGETSNGGYVALGGTPSLGAGGYDIWVVKLNTDGTIVWQKTYDGTQEDDAWAILETSDGGYIVSGGTQYLGGVGYDIWVLKLNIDGTVDWGKIYGGTGWEWPESIQETSDGGYVVVGTTESFGAGQGDMWVLKLNSDGTIAWQKTYGGTDYDSGNFIQQTPDGGYIMAGSTDSFDAGSGDGWILKLNSDGSAAWQKTYGDAGTDYFVSIKPTFDGGYVVVGITESFGAGSGDVWVLKLNSDGTIAWQTTYGGPSDELGYYVHETIQGGYIVSARTESFGAGSNDWWVLKLDSVGAVQWNKTYGDENNNWPTWFELTADGGYINIGSSGLNWWVLKLDPFGYVYGCPPGLIGEASEVNITDTGVTGADTTVTGADTSISAQTISTTVTDTLVTGQDLCSGGFDTDGDGMDDDWEESYFFDTSRDGTGDFDGDGLTDLDEFLNGTDPTDDDTDDDGMPDGWEVDNGLDPLTDDSAGDPDGDGLGNLLEYTLGSDPNIFDDIDNDGESDFWDDSDNDGVFDYIDNCPYDKNPTQDDMDDDGFGDVCDDSDGDGLMDAVDSCPYDYDNDADLDGICADVDNCPHHYNPFVAQWTDKYGVIHYDSQPDFDGDGEGDACDPITPISGEKPSCNPKKEDCETIDDQDGDGLADSAEQTCNGSSCDQDPDCDDDGVSDGSKDPDDSGPIIAGPDNCLCVANLDQTDTDDDGMGDACDPDDDNDQIMDGDDNCPLNANNGQSDNDQDGIGDACDNDRDGDGLTNEEEATLGTDPDNPDTDNDDWCDGPGVEGACNGIPNLDDPTPLGEPQHTIVFKARETQGGPDIIDQWLPEYGNSVFVVAKLKDPSGALINFEGAVTFNLTPSAWSGVAFNDHREVCDPDCSNDYSFSAGDPGDLSPKTVLAGGSPEAIVTIYSFDFGGQAIMSATTTAGGGTVTGTITLPLDWDGDLLPDYWEDLHAAAGFDKNNKNSFSGDLDDGSMDIDTSLDNPYPGDGITNFREFRGVVKDMLTKDGAGKVTSVELMADPIRLDPTKKELFVRGDGYINSTECKPEGANPPYCNDPDVLPFNIGPLPGEENFQNAFEEVNIAVHDVTGMPSFSGTTEPPFLDILVVTNNTTETATIRKPFADGYIDKTVNTVRHYSWDEKGATYLNADSLLYAHDPVDPSEGGCFTYHLNLMHYLYNHPYVDVTTTAGDDVANLDYAQYLDPESMVEDTINENGVLDCATRPKDNEDKDKDTKFKGDRLKTDWRNLQWGSPPLRPGIDPYRVGYQFSTFDANGNGLVELPVVSDSMGITPDQESSAQKVQRHTILHEMGHAVGSINPEHSSDDLCVMYFDSKNWDRADHFGLDPRQQIMIHNEHE